MFGLFGSVTPYILCDASIIQILVLVCVGDRSSSLTFCSYPLCSFLPGPRRKVTVSSVKVAPNVGRRSASGSCMSGMILTCTCGLELVGSGILLRDPRGAPGSPKGILGFHGLAWGPWLNPGLSEIFLEACPKPAACLM